MTENEGKEEFNPPHPQDNSRTLRLKDWRKLSYFYRALYTIRSVQFWKMPGDVRTIVNTKSNELNQTQKFSFGKRIILINGTFSPIWMRHLHLKMMKNWNSYQRVRCKSKPRKHSHYWTCVGSTKWWRIGTLDSRFWRSATSPRESDVWWRYRP